MSYRPAHRPLALGSNYAQTYTHSTATRQPAAHLPPSTTVPPRNPIASSSRNAYGEDDYGRSGVPSTRDPLRFGGGMGTRQNTDTFAQHTAQNRVAEMLPPRGTAATPTQLTQRRSSSSFVGAGSRSIARHVAPPDPYETSAGAAYGRPSSRSTQPTAASSSSFQEDPRQAYERPADPRQGAAYGPSPGASSPQPAMMPATKLHPVNAGSPGSGRGAATSDALPHYSNASSSAAAQQNSGSANIVPVGLRNMGNTCYMNASLQCIVHASGMLLPQLKSLLSGRRVSSSVASALCGLQDLASANGGDGRDSSYYSTPSASNMAGYLQTIKSEAARLNAEFTGGRQNDAHEFIRECLHALHKQINRVGKAPYREIKDIPNEKDSDTAKRWYDYHKERDDSIVYDVFGGFERSVAKCKTCGYRSLAFDPILDISLQISSGAAATRSTFSTLNAAAVDLTKLLHDQCQIEDLTRDSDWICSKCTKVREGHRQVTMFRWPETLVIHLKRFNQSGRKNGTGVTFPAQIGFDKLPLPQLGIFPGQTRLRDPATEPFDPNRGEFSRYVLSGIVMHHGTSSYGHYTAYVRPPRSPRWFECDDGSVRQVSEREVLGATTAAYVLFYTAA